MNKYTYYLLLNITCLIANVIMDLVILHLCVNYSVWWILAMFLTYHRVKPIGDQHE